MSRGEGRTSVKGVEKNEEKERRREGEDSDGGII